MKLNFDMKQSFTTIEALYHTARAHAVSGKTNCNHSLLSESKVNCRFVECFIVSY